MPVFCFLPFKPVFIQFTFIFHNSLIALFVLVTLLHQYLSENQACYIINPDQQTCWISGRNTAICVKCHIPVLPHPGMTELYLLPKRPLLIFVIPIRQVGVEITFSHLQSTSSLLKICVNTNVIFAIFHSSDTESVLHVRLDI